MSGTCSTRGHGGLASTSYFDARTRLVIAVASALAVVAGVGLGQPAIVGAGVVGLLVAGRLIEQYAAGPCGVLKETTDRLISGRRHHATTPGAAKAPPAPPTNGNMTYQAPLQPRPRIATPTTTSGLVEEMLRTNRYALLLKPETVAHLSQDEYLRVIRALDERMSITPEGTVLIGMAAERATLGEALAGVSLNPDKNDSVAYVGPCYLDRWTVTNGDFQHFVDAGGYEQLEFWPEEALPALFDFIDSTGAPAPRYWADGRHAAGEERLPVVGVSWYEAVAYARWVGKRLPGDAEWTKASAWPIESAPGRIAQRRYPWGESFDARRANLWCAERGGPAAVDEYPEGATVGGLEQMVGNVWEWTANSLDEATPASVSFPSALRSIRGGAYNTYFENQATCHFQSGEHPLSRRKNIGIRLALDMAGLASLAPAGVLDAN